jgi:hypothetical protein
VQAILLILVVLAAGYAFLKISGSAQGDAAASGIGDMIKNFDMSSVTGNPNFYPIVASIIISGLIIFAWKNIPDKIKYSALGGAIVYLILVISSH